MQALWWWTKRYAQVLHWQGLAGLGLLLIALLVYSYQIFTMTPALAKAQQQLAQLKVDPQQKMAKVPELQLADFYSAFPDKRQLNRQIIDLHQLADSAEIGLDKVVYQYKKSSGLPLCRYELHFTVVSDYPTIRGFLAAALKQFPNAALEGLEYQRFDRYSTITEADVVLAFYYRDAI